MDGSLDNKYFVNPLIIFYWCLFYFTQFTYLGDYFDYWIFPSVYLVVFLGIFISLFIIEARKVNGYLLVALLPLVFDIILNLSVINYWLFALKYVSLFIISSNTISGQIDPFSKGTQYIYNFYLVSFIVSLPFLFGLDILPSLDSAILRKNSEGNGFSDLYTVTTFFSAYLTGDHAIPIYNIPIYRFTSFHIEPSNFTLHFVPLTILCWKNLGPIKKMLAGSMILMSFSVTSFIVLPTVLVIQLILFSKKVNNVTIAIVMSALFIGVWTSSEYFLNETEVGKLINYKVNESPSAEGSRSQFSFAEMSNIFSTESFNKIPSSMSVGHGTNLLSLMFWVCYIILIGFYSVSNKISNKLALAYYMIHGLKSIYHVYPSMFLIFLIFKNNSDHFRSVSFEKYPNNHV